MGPIYLSRGPLHKKMCKNMSEEDQIKITLTNDITTFKSITGKKYDKTMSLIHLLLQV